MDCPRSEGVQEGGGGEEMRGKRRERRKRRKARLGDMGGWGGWSMRLGK